jgi:hypothetical protein
LRCLLVIALFISTSGVAQKSKLKIDFAIKDTTGSVDIDVAKFYVSGLKIIFQDANDQIAEREHYLINFEEEGSTTIEIKELKGKSIEGIDLCIGTDSLVNVSGAFDGHLDPIHGMYWTWNSGYINIKLEGTFKNQPFEYHIGGYAGEYKTIRQKFLEFNDPKDRYIKIEVDLNHFFDEIVFEEMKVMPPGKIASEIASLFVECIQVAE